MSRKTTLIQVLREVGNPGYILKPYLEETLKFCLERAEAFTDVKIGHPIKAEYYAALACAHEKAGLCDKANQNFELALHHLGELNNSPLSLDPAAFGVYSYQLRAGRLDDAKKTLDATVGSLPDRHFPMGSPMISFCEKVYSLQSELGMFEEGRDALNLALEVSKRLWDVSVVKSYLRLAVFHAEHGDTEGSNHFFEVAKLYTRQSGGYGLSLSYAYMSYAQLELGMTDEAKESLQSAINYKELQLREWIRESFKGDEKDAMYHAIAIAQARLELYDESIGTINRIKHHSPKQHAVEELMIAKAKAGFQHAVEDLMIPWVKPGLVEEALKLPELYSKLPGSFSRGYNAIITAKAKEGDYSGALELVNKHFSEFLAPGAHVKLVREQSKKSIDSTTRELIDHTLSSIDKVPRGGADHVRVQVYSDLASLCSDLLAQLESAEPETSATPVPQSMSISSPSFKEYLAGKMEEALSFTIDPESIKLENGNILDIHNWLENLSKSAYSYSIIGRRDEALKRFEQSFQLAKWALKDGTFSEFNYVDGCDYVIADVARSGDYSLAEEKLAELTNEHPEMVESIQYRLRAHFEIACAQARDKKFDRALEIAKSLQHAASGAYSIIAYEMADAGETEEAKKVLLLAEEKASPDHDNGREDLLHLAATQAKLGMYDEAKQNTYGMKAPVDKMKIYLSIASEAAKAGHQSTVDLMMGLCDSLCPEHRRSIYGGWKREVYPYVISKLADTGLHDIFNEAVGYAIAREYTYSNGGQYLSSPGVYAEAAAAQLRMGQHAQARATIEFAMNEAKSHHPEWARARECGRIVAACHKMIQLLEAA